MAKGNLREAVEPARGKKFDLEAKTGRMSKAAKGQITQDAGGHFAVRVTSAMQGSYAGKSKITQKQASRAARAVMAVQKKKPNLAPKTRRYKPFTKRDDILRQSHHIIALMAKLTGKLSESRIWFSETPIPALGNITAKKLVSDGQADRVLNYLKGLEAGAYQ